MKYLLALSTLLLTLATASAQTWTCTANGVACQPGTAGCVCAEVQQAPPPPVVVAPPACPFGTYWNGGVCVTISQAPVYLPPPTYYYPPHNPYWNTPLNQIPGWHHP